MELGCWRYLLAGDPHVLVSALAGRGAAGEASRVLDACRSLLPTLQDCPDPVEVKALPQMCKAHDY
ncbi:MAG: hypothetical protein DRJ57_01820 [Thermoprotei archaeon]|nr:MAG: hypothetical protein DRJ57_01820 [Thermoprotei archaeon]